MIQKIPDPPAAPVAERAAGPSVVHPLSQRLEALLFASGAALSSQRLASLLEQDVATVEAALVELQAAWGARKGAIELVQITGGFRFMTRAAFHEDVQRLARSSRPESLATTALETLAVVAYRQPLTRADIEAVRGVQCGPVLRALLDRDLIRIAGRSTDPGHPLLYGTTHRFLDHFGLKSLKHLPDVEDLLAVP